MPEIKIYSSLFATKINYVLDLIDVAPIQHGRAKAIEAITNEKGSTVNNWLFNGRLPRDNKKLAIADSIGVSYNYLFNDNIDVKDVSKPEIYKDEQCYLVPYISENEIFNLKSKNIYTVNTRLSIMFPHFDTFIKKYGMGIYITKLSQTTFDPHVNKNSDVIYSENIILEDFRLVIQKDTKTNKLIVKRVIEENQKFFLESLDKKGKLIKEPISKGNNFVSVILTYSNT